MHSKTQFKNLTYYLSLYQFYTWLWNWIHRTPKKLLAWHFYFRSSTPRYRGGGVGPHTFFRTGPPHLLIRPWVFDNRHINFIKKIHWPWKSSDCKSRLCSWQTSTIRFIYLSQVGYGFTCVSLLREFTLKLMYQIFIKYLWNGGTLLNLHICTVWSLFNPSWYSLLICRHPLSTTYIFTNRSFRYASPHLWNQLPVSFRQPCIKHPADDITLSNSSPTCSLHLPSITHSLFHSRLKTHLFHKSFPPQSASTHRTAFSDYTGPDLFCSTVFVLLISFAL